MSETEIRGSDQNQIKFYIGVMANAMADQKLLRQELWMLAQGNDSISIRNQKPRFGAAGLNC